MSFREAFFYVDAVFLVGGIAYLLFRNLPLRRNTEPEPANLRTFLDDDALEGRRLERVLGWSLLWVVVVAASLAIYFLAEPTRQADATVAFHERSVERGAVLFSNKQSAHYESEFSLLCADCHGVDGTGGVAPFVLQPEADKCTKAANKNNPAVPECLPKRVGWQAPNLTLAGLRYTKAQIAQIVTYGRPGSPMQPWGVKSGKGAKDVQSIDDLVNYIESIKTTPAKAQAQAAELLAAYRSDATALITTSGDALTAAKSDLAAGQADSKTSANRLTFLENTVTIAAANLDQAIANNEDIQAQSDGAVLFRLNCARCHTKGWSYHVTDQGRADLPTLAPQGSGAYGPNLTGGSVLLQFPGQVGLQNQTSWVTIGVPANQSYGTRGISSGRMPHFGRVLTKAQISAIIDYERNL